MKCILPPIVAVVGLSDSGKTTLMVDLIPEMRRHGLRVGTIKHHPHDLDVELPGKDTWKHRRAGADGTVLSTPSTIAVIRSAGRDHSPAELAGLLADMDIVLAEGYKNAEVPKVEVHRADLGRPPLCLDDPFLLALVTEADVPLSPVPRFHPRDASGLARFLLRRLGLRP
ncbi:MAG: molybdopterin-guanine dinucleotide biosynthesis protein B [Deltaproteobacteria bacterium]|nr:molybdopterin-guanine dinucleotide biosynthesis protein B [Deltaproteobacteria bacterium]